MLVGNVIFVMERYHRNKVAKQFREMLRDKKLVCLDIPDEFERMDPVLIQLLEEGVARSVRLVRSV
ncbi:hypothetical protein L6R29_10210 [Myxococcota bacterium]|nr:hypothetical protein [Myxococcota bacterium]